MTIGTHLLSLGVAVVRDEAPGANITMLKILGCKSQASARNQCAPTGAQGNSLRTLAAHTLTIKRCRHQGPIESKSVQGLVRNPERLACSRHGTPRQTNPTGEC